MKRRVVNYVSVVFFCILLISCSGNEQQTEPRFYIDNAEYGFASNADIDFNNLHYQKFPVLDRGSESAATVEFHLMFNTVNKYFVDKYSNNSENTSNNELYQSYRDSENYSFGFAKILLLHLNTITAEDIKSDWPETVRTRNDLNNLMTVGNPLDRYFKAEPIDMYIWLNIYARWGLVVEGFIDKDTFYREILAFINNESAMPTINDTFLKRPVREIPFNDRLLESFTGDGVYFEDFSMMGKSIFLLGFPRYYLDRIGIAPDNTTWGLAFLRYWDQVLASDKLMGVLR